MQDLRLIKTQEYHLSITAITCVPQTTHLLHIFPNDRCEGSITVCEELLFIS